jgi:hypothetical protein
MKYVFDFGIESKSSRIFFLVDRILGTLRGQPDLLKSVCLRVLHHLKEDVFKVFCYINMHIRMLTML